MNREQICLQQWNHYTSICELYVTLYVLLTLTVHNIPICCRPILSYFEMNVTSTFLAVKYYLSSLPWQEQGCTNASCCSLEHQDGCMLVSCCSFEWWDGCMPASFEHAHCRIPGSQMLHLLHSMPINITQSSLLLD